MSNSELRGALSARPHEPEANHIMAESGIHSLGIGNSVRDGRLYVPRDAGDQPRPLIVALHGAGGDGSSMLRLLGGNVLGKSAVLLAPEARKHTWDFLLDDFGPDVRFLNQALQITFRQCRIDPTRIALAGFSDGASYALTIGLANGDLFTHVMAFSPGFMRPPRLQGSPRVYISHGDEDEVLPIGLCSRRILPELERLQVDLTYREFHGPHTVPDGILDEALRWFLGADAV